MLRFGDISVLIENARKTPHLIEHKHECGCEYCDCDDVNYVCSVCRYEHPDLDIFENYKCPKCKTKLISEEEVNDLVLKKQFYLPVL